MRVLATSILFLTCLTATGAQSAPITGPKVTPAPVASPHGHYEFHVDAWLSLHHFLHHLARQEAREARLRNRVPILQQDLDALSPAFRQALPDALEAYQPYLDTDLLFTDGTRANARALLDSPDAVPDPAVRAALRTLMPHYQRDLWPAHRAEAIALRDRLLGDLDTSEAEISQRLADYLGSDWPDAPIRVDIVAYANWAGAYTDHGPNHITLAATDPDAGGAHAFELLIHESAHTTPLGDHIIPLTQAAMEAAGIENRRIWHNILFYVTGRITKAVHGGEDYVLYVDHTGIANRPHLSATFDILESVWDEADGLEAYTRAVAEGLAEDAAAPD